MTDQTSFTDLLVDDDATVERVARALWSVQARGLLTSWDAQDDEHQEFTREQARAAIAAIAGEVA